MTVEIVNADARTALAAMPGGSVHCVVTSPPYWGLRDYGLEPLVWGGAGDDCEHEWGEEIIENATNHTGKACGVNRAADGDRVPEVAPTRGADAGGGDVNKTGIEWTEFSSNPLYVVDKETGKRGWFCEKVSPGCAHCYASALNIRRGTGHAYLPANRDKVEWRLNERELEAILRRRKPARIFLCDMTDLFHPDVPDEFIDRIFQIMREAQQHTFQVLTKRPERMREYIKGRWSHTMSYGLLPNVWLGVSVENQRWADERIPVLLDTPAAVRFLSCEPLLGSLDLRPYLDAGCQKADQKIGTLGHSQVMGKSHGNGISWVIVGGESGGPEKRRLVERCDHRGDTPLARYDTKCAICGAWRNRAPGWRPKPQALEWVRSLRDQAVAAGVPFFFKQWGGPRPKSAGRLLDGRESNQMPDSVEVTA